MPRQPISVVDPFGARLATLDVRCENGHFIGKIALGTAAESLKSLFARFEHLVEGQMFNLADEVEAEIDSLHLRVAFDDGTTAEVSDLQAFPSTGAVSFVVCQPTVVR